MKRPLSALLPALALLAACSGPLPSGLSSSAPSASRSGERGAVAAACRSQAERVVNYRDRGQTMRADDYNARIGTTSYLGPQVMTDQIAQVYERDRIAADCVRSAEPPRTAPSGGLSGR
ncbi:hypothetical protein [Muricoccus aerilatus]|uniref:hypothetical protein n=1 Tax=Muricoccus aerilatus TaxID=452982 RepID=UPI0005C1E39B|nr:hypothetical protein [Roseomonas aerilata]